MCFYCVAYSQANASNCPICGNRLSVPKVDFIEKSKEIWQLAKELDKECHMVIIQNGVVSILQNTWMMNMD